MAYRSIHGKLYPRGKINRHDEGEVNMKILADHAKGVVVIDFGKPVTWFALESDKVDEFIEVLKKYRAELVS